MPAVTPRLVVREHDPGRVRRLVLFALGAWLVTLASAAALMRWLVPQPASVALTAEAESLRGENDALKSRVVVLQRSEQVAKAAVSDLQQTIKEREEEIAGLRADLAFYGRLVGGAKREGLAVHDLRMRAVAGSPHAWNFVATLTQNLKKGQTSTGRLKVSLEGVRGGRLESVDWAALTQAQGGAGIEYAFKYFQQVKGTIMIPEGFAPNRVRVEVVGDDGRAEQEFPWADAAKGEETDDVRQ